MPFERARTDEQINERKQEIIKACAILYDAEDIEGVTIKAISEITSFVRSSVYTYYKTKEEILLDLLLEDLRQWSQDLVQVMTVHDLLTKEEYCRIITKTLADNERMVKLFSLLYAILEKNCRVEKLTEFKTEIHTLMAPFPQSVQKYFPDASHEAQQVFTVNAVSLISGLYPFCNLSDKQKQAMSNAGIVHEPVDFATIYYQGLLALASLL